MNIHKNARLTVHGRNQIVLQSGFVGVKAAASAAGVSQRTAVKWRRRFSGGGVSELHDRSSRPHRSPNAYSARVWRWVRRLRRWCHWTMRRIAWSLEISLSSVWRFCRAMGITHLGPLPGPVQRYEHGTAGDLLHMDTKKVPGLGGRGSGYEVMHVAIDDHSRVAFVQVLPDETKFSAIAFLNAAVTYFQRKGVRIRGLLTDNGSAYWSKDFSAACRDLDIKQRYTRPHRPQTNGKAERFIQTCLREWIRPNRYQTSAERKKGLKAWLKYYNEQRPHSALNYLPPVSRLQNNVLKHNSFVLRVGCLWGPYSAST